ncbi:MAG: tetratricopeptide repeat protein [Paracoccaceae bacterium]
MAAASEADCLSDDPRRAVAGCNTLLDQNGTDVARNAQWLTARARALYELGDFSAARRDLDAALLLDPFDPAALFWLGRLHWSEANTNRALKAFEAARAANPGFAPARAALASMALLNEEMDVAQQEIGVAMLLAPNDPFVLVVQAAVLDALGAEDSAKARIDQARAALPEEHKTTRDLIENRGVAIAAPGPAVDGPTIETPDGLSVNRFGLGPGSVQDVAVWSEGDVAVGGYAEVGAQAVAFVARVASDGEVLWRQDSRNSTGSRVDAVAAGPDGTLYAFGRETDPGADQSSGLIAFDDTGNFLWEADLGPTHPNHPVHLTVLPDERIAVLRRVGTTLGLTFIGSRGKPDGEVIFFSADVAEVSAITQRDDMLIAVGLAYEVDRKVPVLQVLRPDGTSQWRARLDASPGVVDPVSVAAVSADHVVVLSRSRNGGYVLTEARADGRQRQLGRLTHPVSLPRLLLTPDDTLGIAALEKSGSIWAEERDLDGSVSGRARIPWVDPGDVQQMVLPLGDTPIALGGSWNGEASIWLNVETDGTTASVAARPASGQTDIAAAVRRCRAHKADAADVRAWASAPLGPTQITREEAQEVFDACQQALTQNKGDPELSFLAGWAAHNLGRDDAVEVFLGLAADAGHSPALYVLSLRSDAEVALDYLEKAAEAGQPEALFDYAMRLKHRDGVDGDNPRRFRYLTAAVDAGLVEALAELGLMYEYGMATTADFDRAAELYRRSAERGQGKGHYQLGSLYDSGRGVVQDYALALSHYQQAEALDYALASLAIGWMYESGRGVPQDDARAVQYITKSAERGSRAAQDYLGGLYAYGVMVPQDYGKARVWFERAAEQGHLGAMDELGWLYLRGLGVAEDVPRAVGYFREAADRGYGLAQLQMGTLYEFGTGVPQNTEEAIRWYRLARQSGQTRALVYLAEIYAAGRGIPRNVIRAANLYEDALKEGEKQALTSLAILYESSPQVYDPDRAGLLYVQALQDGQAYAMERTTPWDRQTARVVQTELKRLGLYSGGIDGVMGAGSRQAMARLCNCN